jgi:hypothetical protein
VSTPFDFEVSRGNTFIFDIIVTQNGLPIDISLATFIFAARLNYLDSPVVFEKTSTPANGIAITDGPNGQARITLVPADTTNLHNLSEPLVADLRMTDVASQVFTLIRGKIRIKPVAVPIP